MGLPYDCEVDILIREAPKNPYYIEPRQDVPLKTEFKPVVKVLSRKPAPSVISRIDPVSGIEKLTIEDEDDEDEEESRKLTLTMEERQLKAQREREEKQRKYEEVRERLFGTSDPTSTPSSTSLRSSTPPVPRNSGESRTTKTKGSREPKTSSAAGTSHRQLFDPNYTAKPDSTHVSRKDTQPIGSGPSAPDEELPIRDPRGPDGSGRGGFGFANRGGKAT